MGGDAAGWPQGAAPPAATAPGDFPLQCLLVSWEKIQPAWRKHWLRWAARWVDKPAASQGRWPWRMKPGAGTALRCPPCSLPQRHTHHSAHSTGLVFHTVDMCDLWGQPWAQTRAPLLEAHTLAAGLEAADPPSALVAAAWEALSCLDGFSITHVGPALGCLVPGMWLSSGCREQRGARDPMGSTCTSPNAVQGSTQVPAPAQALCCREHDSWGALGCPK